MNKYENLYVITPELEEEAIKAIIEKFSGIITANGGEIESVDEWGKRRLAYAINYKTEGYYVLMYITAPSDLPRELERNLQISDSVLRYLVVRFEGPIPAKREPLKPFVPHNAAPAAAPVAPVAPAAAPVVEETAEEEAPETEAE